MLGLKNDSALSIVGFTAVVEAPDLKRSEAIRRWQKLGNPILDTDGHKIIAVDEVYNPDENIGTLVWQCDFCLSHSKKKETILRHEEICAKNPDRNIR